MESMDDSLYPTSENNLSIQLLHNNLTKPPLLFRILVVIQNIENLGFVLVLLMMLNSMILDLSSDMNYFSIFTIITLEAFIGGILYISVHFLLLFTRVPYKLQVFSLIWSVGGFLIPGIILGGFDNTSILVLMLFLPVVLQLIYILLDRRVKNYLQFQSTEYYNGLIARLLNRIEVIEEELSKLKASRQ